MHRRVGEVAVGLGSFVPSPGAPAPHGFDLIVSFRYPNPVMLGSQISDDWQAAFQWASAMLAEATNDQIFIRRVTFYNQPFKEDDADIWIYDQDRSGANLVTGTDLYGFGTPGKKIEIGTNALAFPGLIVHELGHYAFTLGDEYSPPANCIPLPAPPDPGFPDGACIMQLGQNSIIRDVLTGDVRWPEPTNFPIVTEFCTGTNHGAGTNQGATPCWQHIVTFNDPLTGAPLYQITENNTKPVVNHELDNLPQQPAVVWLQNQQAPPRFALVLDKSGSMAAQQAIAGVRFGANYWIDLELFLGSRLAIVPYATVPAAGAQAFPLDAIDAASAATAHGVVGPLQPGGATNITAALLAGQAQLGTAPAAFKNTMILLSDGRHNVGNQPTANQLAAIKADDIRVFTLGFGPNVQETLLKDIAAATNGTYVKILGWAPSVAAQQQIETELAEIAASTHSGLVASRRVVLPDPEHDVIGRPKPRYDPDDLEAAADIDLGIDPGWGIDVDASVEEGCERATFSMTRPHDMEAQLYLRRPDGSIVDPADPAVQFTGQPDAPYVIYVVENPDPGVWTMRGLREAPRLELPLALFAFCETPGIVVGLTGTSQVYDPGDEIVLGLEATSGRRLTGVSARAVPARSSADEAPTEPFDFAERIAGQGQYVIDGLQLFEPGTYEFVLEVESDGSAVEARDEVRATEFGMELDPPYQPPPFRRLSRFQIHVGPLSDGEDTDGADDDEDLQAS